MAQTINIDNPQTPNEILIALKTPGTFYNKLAIAALFAQAIEKTYHEHVIIHWIYIYILQEKLEHARLENEAVKQSTDMQKIMDHAIADAKEMLPEKALENPLRHLFDNTIELQACIFEDDLEINKIDNAWHQRQEQKTKVFDEDKITAILSKEEKINKTDLDKKVLEIEKIIKEVTAAPSKIIESATHLIQSAAQKTGEGLGLHKDPVHLAGVASQVMHMNAVVKQLKLAKAIIPGDEQSTVLAGAKIANKFGVAFAYDNKDKKAVAECAARILHREECMAQVHANLGLLKDISQLRNNTNTVAHLGIPELKPVSMPRATRTMKDPDPLVLAPSAPGKKSQKSETLSNEDEQLRRHRHHPLSTKLKPPGT